MKKLIALILAAIMVCCLFAGCGSSTTAAPAATEEPAAVEEAAPAEEAAEETSSITKITFATNPEFPPFESIEANGVLGDYDGIDMAIVVKMGEILGVDVEMESMEFDSLLIALQNGQIDATIAGMTVTEERAMAVDFSTPYYTATQVMIVPEGSDITCAADMEGKSIAVVQGYTGETVVSELGYDYEAFKKGTECVMELTNGKCDVVVIDSATAQKYIADNPGLVVVEDEDAFGAEEYAIAVQKGNTELLDMINSAIEQMLADGTIAEIATQYIDAD